MTQFSTLTELLENSGFEPGFFDMGRRVARIDREEFMRFELTEAPYPLPLRRQAWLGFLLRESTKQGEPRIWFVHFPLDEQGKLVPAARDEFVHNLLEVAAIAQDDDDRNARLQRALQDNPYVFRPHTEHMACFHAKTTLLLDQPPSRFYRHARDYFSGTLGWDQWSFIGFQGIADMAARHGEADNDRILSEAIPQLPPAPLEALCHCLESEAISEALTQALFTRARLALATAQPDIKVVSACVRGSALSPMDALKRHWMNELMAHEAASRSDILVAIGGRAWELLLDTEIREVFLSCLAVNDLGQDLFDALLSDLLFLPATRTLLLESLRRPQRPKPLETAIGAFFKRLRTP